MVAVASECAVAAETYGPRRAHGCETREGGDRSPRVSQESGTSGLAGKSRTGGRAEWLERAERCASTGGDWRSRSVAERRRARGRTERRSAGGRPGREAGGRPLARRAMDIGAEHGAAGHSSVVAWISGGARAAMTREQLMAGAGIQVRRACSSAARFLALAARPRR